MNKHLRITKWDNGLIEAICASVIVISAILTATYFGFGDGPIVTLQAVVYAFAVDGMFYLAVRLARHYFAQGWGRAHAGVFWLLVACLAGAFTWHNNLLFAANSWHLDAQALSRAGVSDGLELQLHAIIPVAVVLFGAIIPRPHRQQTAEEIRAEAERKLALMQAKNAVRAATASEAGAGLRGVVGGFFGQALHTAEKQQQASIEREARRARHAEQQRMIDQADADLLEECRDEDGDLDMPLLEQRLREAGKWPVSVAVLPVEEETQISDPEMSAITPAGLPKWLTAEQVAERLSISVYQANQRMKPNYSGRYSRINSREFSRNGKPVRKAYYKTVDALAEKENVHASVHENVQADV